MRTTSAASTLAVVLALVFAFPGPVAAAETRRVSLAHDGSQANSASLEPSISSTGDLIAFRSQATNLVGSDTNGVDDVFIRDLQTGTTTRVSVSTAGTQANGTSSTPAISANGRYVVFESNATNLVGSDTNGAYDIFVRDTQANTTTRVSVSTGGAQGNDHSFWPVISDDGRYVAYQSLATNLVGGDTNGATDIFVRDTQMNTTTRVSVSTGGTQGDGESWSAAISGTGRYLAFISSASNLVTGDSNSTDDIFVRDTQTNVTTRVSVASDATQADNMSFAPSISNDGRYVAFASWASNLAGTDGNSEPDVFVRDMQANTTTRVSVSSGGAEGNGTSANPVVAGDGRFIAFQSTASNLVAGDTNGATDVFLRDLGAGTTVRLSVGDGGEANGPSQDVTASATGRFLAFGSLASNLVAGDTNWATDIFWRDWAVLRPDAGIKRTSQGAYVGDGAYDASGAGQAVQARVKAGKSASFDLRFENDAAWDDAFTLDGCGNSRGFALTYLADTTNVTGPVRDGTYVTADLTPGQSADLRLTVQTKKTVKPGTTKVCLVKATSLADPGAADAVKALVKVR